MKRYLVLTISLILMAPGGFALYILANSKAGLPLDSNFWLIAFAIGFAGTAWGLIAPKKRINRKIEKNK